MVAMKYVKMAELVQAAYRSCVWSSGNNSHNSTTSHEEGVPASNKTTQWLHYISSARGFMRTCGEALPATFNIRLASCAQATPQ
jgi:hypothetical protein